MEQETAEVSENAPLKQLKERVQLFQTDAKAALNAAKKDYEHVKKAMRNLQAKSELRAFVQARLKGSTAKKPKASAKKVADKKAVLAQATP